MKAAVLGSPIAHSRSPLLHRAAYAAQDLPWTYVAIEIKSGGLRTFKESLDGSWKGLSLTMPLKEEVLDLLDECDDLARRTRSANTVVVSDGKWCGSNTDVFGMVQSLRSVGASGASGGILGGGATARSAVAALADLGVGHVSIWARRSTAIEEIGALAKSFGMDWSATEEPPLDVDIVVNTVPAGAVAAVGGSGYLLDAIYEPWPTPLTTAWSPDRCVTGLDLLLWQAIGQVQAMTGKPAPYEAMRAALWADSGYPQLPE